MGNMRLHSIPVPLLQLIASILLAPSPLVQAKPHPAASNLAGFHFNDLFARYDCAGTYCGFSSQLCCTAGSTCYTDASDQAQCGAGAATAAVAAGGYWSTYTSIYTEVDTVLTTALMSTYVQSVAAAATATAGCNYAVNETPCGSICCASNQYCASAGQCAAAVGAGSSGYYSSYATPTPTPGVIVGGGGATGSAAIRGTSSSLVLVTSTQTPTTTEPFMAPVQTGANITLTSQGAQHSGLSGGAIAGIVIGVLLGLFLLGLLCFYCCLRGLWNGFAALFGGGKRKRRTVEVEEYERRSHHASGRGGGGGGRTWYGASRPARGSSRYEERNERKSKGNGVFGLGVGLAGLWALLGLKRQRGNKRRQEEKSEYSYSSDYYTSASSASSDDRRTRDDRRSMSRR